MKKVTILLFLVIALLNVNAQTLDQSLADFVMTAYVDQSISCRFNNDGSIQIDNEPSGQYDYYLKKGTDTFHNQTGRFEDLKPGTYKVWSKNIIGVTKTTSLKVTTPLKLSVTLSPITKPTLNNNNGSLIANIKGGTSELQPMLISWYKVNGDSSLTHLNPTDNWISIMENLSAGYYLVVLEDDNGCFYTKKYLLRR